MIRRIREMANRLPITWGLTELASRSVAQSARIHPWQIRNGRGSHLSVGEDSIISARISYDRPGANVVIGARSFTSKALLVAAERITIGDDVQISWGVTIVDHDSHSLDWSKRKDDVLEWGRGRKDWTHVKIAPVIISDKVWIGFGVSILKGVTIGEGVVIGAGAVVTKNIPAWSVVAGNPARIIGEAPQL